MEDLETFRKEVYPTLISKGVEPPKPDSPTEQTMFQRWLRGREKLGANSE